MSADRATRVERLKTIRDGLETDLAVRTAEWVASGSPPGVSIDGESWDWVAWTTARLEQIAKLTDIIRLAAAPWVVRSRQRG